jgi:hypothetical protein
MLSAIEFVMWTKLAYLTLPEALLSTMVGKRRMPAPLSARYRGALRKEFLKAGVPWEYDQPREGRHPFDRAPKLPKHIRNRSAKVSRIVKALERQNELQTKYRNDVASRKRLTGLDILLKSTLGSLIKKK